MIDVTVAVLSGGNSKRFEKDKTKALLHSKPLFQYGLECGLKVSDNVIHISKNKEKYKPFMENVLYYEDDLKEVCPMSGLIKAGMQAVYNKVFVISADSPLVTPEFIIYMFSIMEDYDVVMPVVNEKHYPLICLYKKNVLQSMEKDYNIGNYKLIKSIEKHKVKYVDEKEILLKGFSKTIFTNINYQIDLQNLQT